MVIDGQIQLSHPYLSRHQLVQQRLKQIVEHRPFPAMQVNLAVNGVEYGDDLALLAERWDQDRKSFEFCRIYTRQICCFVSHLQKYALP